MAGPIWWRTTDLTRWGPSNSGGNLSATMFDENNWYLLSLINGIIASPPQAVSIDYFTLVGDQLTIHMTDHSSRGPFTLPVSVWHFTNPPTGLWLPNTLYFPLDIVTWNGSVYLRLIQGTSGVSFDPYQTDGSGHYLWGLLLTQPGLQLPTGGADGMVLTKIDGHDFNCDWEYPIPIGGTTGQILAKSSNTDFNTKWETITQLPNVNTVLHGGGVDVLDPTLGQIFSIIPDMDVTINAASTPINGPFVLVVTTSGTSSFNVTFGTGFKSQGVLATGTVSGKKFTVTFMGDGTNLNELCRTTAM